MDGTLKVKEAPADGKAGSEDNGRNKGYMDIENYPEIRSKVRDETR